MSPSAAAGTYFDRMLMTTAELFFPYEHDLLLRPILSKLTKAQDHPTLLDVGSGNGAYLSLVSRCYPTLRCVGLEMDERIFPYAKARERAPQLIFLPQAYETYEANQTYDLVLVRLAAVHLADRGHFAQWLRRHTHPGSQVLIIDVDDSCLDPSGPASLPLFHALYAQARQKLALSRILRVQDELTLELAQAGYTKPALHSFRIEGNSTAFKARMRHYMELVTYMHGESPADPRRQAEWKAWEQSSQASYSIGMFGLIVAVK